MVRIEFSCGHAVSVPDGVSVEHEETSEFQASRGRTHKTQITLSDGSVWTLDHGFSS